MGLVFSNLIRALVAGRKIPTGRWSGDWILVLTTWWLEGAEALNSDKSWSSSRHPDHYDGFGSPLCPCKVRGRNRRA